ncbi:MAG: cadherin domain-containing protein [Rhodospirillales bacterium]|nr:cadherin domain-containing protein [Rhodospirillales bacterium]
MYLQLNLAVGGNWPGAPNNSTVFPADYMIDYVRVYGPRESSFVLQTIESLEVEEHAPVGTKVGVVMALTSDGQPADVTYSLLNDPLGRFAIDPKNGTISVANSNLIDFELDAAPTFTVLAAAPDGSRATLNTAASLIDIADSDASSVSAIKFDGHGDVSVPHHKALDPTGDFTIEVRARFDSFSGHQILVQKSTDWEKNGFFLKLTNGTLEFLHGSPKGALPTPNGSIDLLQEDNHGIALNAWHDIALVRKGANEYFYVDGNLIASAASKSSLVSSNGEFIIGEGVIGSIDEVRLWDHSRQPDDIKSDLGADLTGNEHGLVAHYTFQDSGTAVVDRTGNGHDGVVTKATWVDGSGKGDTSKINEIDGTDKSETLNGTNEDDSIHGKGGRDTINGRDGEDEIHGDAGNDRLNGQDGNDVLLGGPGNDRLQGGAGADSLNGGPGRDVLIGGDGEDTFIFDDGNRADTVRDFKPGLDKIWLKISAFADNNIGDFSEYLRTKVTNGDLLIQFDGNGELKGGTQTLAILKDGKDLNLEQLIADGDLWVT